MSKVMNDGLLFLKLIPQYCYLHSLFIIWAMIGSDQRNCGRNKYWVCNEYFKEPDFLFLQLPCFESPLSPGCLNDHKNSILVQFLELSYYLGDHIKSTMWYLSDDCSFKTRRLWHQDDTGWGVRWRWRSNKTKSHLSLLLLLLLLCPDE